MATLLPERVYQNLRRKLLTGKLSPGTRLDYKKISAELGVSVTPVREAMGKLASEGLVDLVPRAGAMVRKLGGQEAVQLYGVREAIETYAAAKAAEKISEGRLQQLTSLLDKMRALIAKTARSKSKVMSGENLAEFLEADLAFHMTIIEAAGNPRLTKLAGDSHIHSRIFGVERFGHDRELLEEADQTHRSIYAALKRRDGAKASELISKHINRSLELTLSHLDQGFGHQTKGIWQNRHCGKPMFSAMYKAEPTDFHVANCAENRRFIFPDSLVGRA
jgi:DNA-binding GntR family transcriptional regulator